MSSPPVKPTTATSPAYDAESKADNFFTTNPIAAITVLLSLVALVLAIASVPLSWINVTIESDTSFSFSASPARTIADFKIGLFEVTGCDIYRSGSRVCKKVELECPPSISICGKLNSLKGLTITSIFAAFGALSTLVYIFDIRSKAKVSASTAPNPAMQQQTTPKPVAVEDGKTGEVYYVIPTPPTPTVTPTPETLTSLSADERTVISTSVFFACLVFILMLVAFLIGLDVNAEFTKNATTSSSIFEATQDTMLFRMGEGMGLAIGSAVTSALAGLFCAHVFQSELKLTGADGAENKA